VAWCNFVQTKVKRTVDTKCLEKKCWELHQKNGTETNLQFKKWLQVLWNSWTHFAQSNQLKHNVSNECISEVGASLNTNQLHQKYHDEIEWHASDESTWRNTNVALQARLVIPYLVIPYLYLKIWNKSLENNLQECT
jgi:hypothetical protein